MEQLVIPLHKKLHWARKAFSINTKAILRWTNKSHQSKHRSSDAWFTRNEGKSKNRAHRHPPVANRSIGNVGKGQEFISHRAPVGNHVVGHQWIIGPQLAEFQERQRALVYAVNSPVAMDWTINRTGAQAMANKLASERHDIALTLRTRRSVANQYELLGFCRLRAREEQSRHTASVDEMSKRTCAQCSVGHVLVEVHSTQCSEQAASI